MTGVNGRKFSAQRLRAAIADSGTQRQVELLVLDGDTFKTVKLEYSEGPKYLELTRSAGREDVLAAIMKPVISPEKKEAATK